MTPSPYEILCELAERELELVGDGRLDALTDLQAERTKLIATLPSTPPAGARASLRRCALLTRRVEIELQRARQALLLEFSAVAQGQRAANGYKPPSLTPPRVTASA